MSGSHFSVSSAHVTKSPGGNPENLARSQRDKCKSASRHGPSQVSNHCFLHGVGFVFCWF